MHVKFKLIMFLNQALNRKLYLVFHFIFYQGNKVLKRYPYFYIHSGARDYDFLFVYKGKYVFRGQFLFFFSPSN